MKRKIFIIVLLGIITALIAACSSGAPEKVPAVYAPAASIAEGQLLPVRTLDLSFDVSGRVSEVLVADGDRVRKGQVLARLDDSAELEAVLAGAKNEALVAQQELDDYKEAATVNLAQSQIEAILARKRRTTTLNNYNASKSTESTARLEEATGNMEIAQALFERIEANGGLDPDRLNTLEAQLESATANVASAEAAIDELMLRAPMNGIIVDVGLIPGQRLEPGEVVMAVADYSEWIVKTDNLTEIEVVNVALGQEVNVSLDALPELLLKGEVADINSRFEEKRGDITYTVTVVLRETDPLMRWGMTAAVEFAK